jgi:hypothetical protein
VVRIHDRPSRTPRPWGSVLPPDEDVGVRLVRLLAVALATGCFVVTGELWSSALNPSPTIVFPTPVQPPPRLLPGDLSRHGPPGILRLKPVPTYPIPRAKRLTHGHYGAEARRGGAAHHAGRTSVVARQRPSTPAVAPTAPSPVLAPVPTPVPAPPPKPAPGPKAPPAPPKSPGPPTPPAPTPTPGPATPPTPTPPAPPPAPSSPPTPPPASTPEPPPPTPPTPTPAPDTRPGNGYGDTNHTHTGPPGQAGR